MLMKKLLKITWVETACAKMNISPLETWVLPRNVGQIGPVGSMSRPAYTAIGAEKTSQSTEMQLIKVRITK